MVFKFYVSLYQKKMIGIYKITNPIGQVYIGQSKNINDRFAFYKRLACKGHRRLYQSLVNYGVLNHTFEVIKECNKNELNKYERYYQQLYECITEKGLNCQYVEDEGMKRKFSNETIERIRAYSLNRPQVINEKIRNTLTGKKQTETHKLNSSISRRKKIIDIITLEIYDSLTDAANKNNIKTNTLSRQLTGYSKNKTNLVYFKNYKL